LDSRDFLTRGQIGRKTQIGVGLIDGQRDGIVFTSRDADFRKNAASALNISLNSVKEPVLVVTKKNKSVLERLAGWLRARNADREDRIDVPLLLIDDEADNASINTRQNPGETTAINRAIRDLLKLFRRSSYVGFTATPFANIFIDPASTDDMLGDDLFPRDFIHVLEAPDNYVGMNVIFSGADPDVPEIPVPDPSTTFLRTIDDEDDWLPPSHRQDVEIEQLPDSLRRALRCFLLATVIRDLRASHRVTERGGTIHRSMLVNVSRFTAVQNRVAETLHIELEDIQRAVRLHGALPPAGAAGRSVAIRNLSEVFESEFSDCGFRWEQVLSELHPSIASVVVQPVNQSTGAASLDYAQMTAPPGLRVIAVGGNSLSRGLTLEGLSTSYFLRNARAYDTLLQMGRWFGYRAGYGDLCRLWLTAEGAGWYRHVTEATAELKHDFARMRRRQATPREFGLRVRTHPDTLLITARNKMASGVDVVGDTRYISLIGRMVESTRLYADERRNRQNLELVEKFVATLVASDGMPHESPHGGAVIWKNVPADTVAFFLDDFLVHPLNHDFQGDSIAEFLRELPSRGDTSLARWTVAVLTTGRGQPAPLTSLPGVSIIAKERKVREKKEVGSLMVSGKGSRVGSRRDVRHGLTLDEASRVGDTVRGDKPDIKEIPEDAYRAVMQAPLLLIYLLRGTGEVDKVSYRNGLILPAIALHFPGAVDPDAPVNARGVST
jgi:Z1 domain